MDVGEAGQLDGVGAHGGGGAVDEEGQLLAVREGLPRLRQREADVVADDGGEGREGDGCGLWGGGGLAV